jgi:hypothetical protein
MRGAVAVGVLLGCALAVDRAPAQLPRPAPGALPGAPAPGAPPPAPKKPQAVRVDAHPIGLVDQGASGSARFDVLRAFNMKASTQALALQIRILDAGSRARHQTAVVESGDVPALMAALSEMGKTVEARKRGEPGAGGPSHRFGSLDIGLSPPGSEDRVYLATGEKDPVRVTLDLDGLSRVEALVRRAADKMRELERALEKG